MAVSIKNAETIALIRELASLRGQGITEMLTDVVGRAVERERVKERYEIEKARRRVEADQE
jgi:hypothetical protein